MHSGDRLRLVMSEQRMSISKLSRLTGLSRSTIRRMRSGDLCGSLHSWLIVSNALGVPLDSILEDDERDI